MKANKQDQILAVRKAQFEPPPGRQSLGDQKISDCANIIKINSIFPPSHLHLSVLHTVSKCHHCFQAGFVEKLPLQ